MVQRADWPSEPAPFRRYENGPIPRHALSVARLRIACVQSFVEFKSRPCTGQNPDVPSVPSFYISLHEGLVSVRALVHNGPGPGSVFPDSDN